MRNIADTIRRLNVKNIVNNFGDIRTNSRLDILPDFGSNPGRLRAWKYIPAALPANSPLVVILHGCTQTAAEYDLGSGWSALADRFGFALLFPEQQRVNNPNLCFNWFSPSQTTRGHGEVLSIR
ncbi:poly(3-hydroxybutyrate) depolymerase, partial [Phyllobacterium endophyticum]